MSDHKPARFTCEEECIVAQSGPRTWAIIHGDAVYLHRSKGQACQYAHTLLVSDEYVYMHIRPVYDQNTDGKLVTHTLWRFVPRSIVPLHVLLGLDLLVTVVDCRKKWKKPPLSQRGGFIAWMLNGGFL